MLTPRFGIWGVYDPSSCDLCLISNSIYLSTFLYWSSGNLMLWYDHTWSAITIQVITAHCAHAHASCQPKPEHSTLALVLVHFCLQQDLDAQGIRVNHQGWGYPQPAGQPMQAGQIMQAQQNMQAARARTTPILTTLRYLGFLQSSRLLLQFSISLTVLSTKNMLL